MKDVKAGDIIVHTDGDEAKVIDVLPNSFLRSGWGDFEEAGGWYTFAEAEKKGWRIIGSEETIKNISIEELEKYKKRKEEEGYIPTIEMLIEDLKNPTQ